jgi:hypothetical protein
MKFTGTAVQGSGMSACDVVDGARSWQRSAIG